MRFALADTSLETPTDPANLPPGKWPVDFVVVANDAVESRQSDCRECCNENEGVNDNGVEVCNNE
jgi:hypothetical protein